MSGLKLSFLNLNVGRVTWDGESEARYICRDIVVDIRLPNGVILVAQRLHGWYRPGIDFDLHIDAVLTLTMLIENAILPMQVTQDAVIVALILFDAKAFSFLEESW